MTSDQQTLMDSLTEQQLIEYLVVRMKRTEQRIKTLSRLVSQHEQLLGWFQTQLSNRVSGCLIRHKSDGKEYPLGYVPDDRYPWRIGPDWSADSTFLIENFDLVKP